MIRGEHREGILLHFQELTVTPPRLTDLDKPGGDHVTTDSVVDSEGLRVGVIGQATGRKGQVCSPGLQLDGVLTTTNTLPMSIEDTSFCILYTRVQGGHVNKADM